MIDLPYDDLTSEIRLADWAELQAIVSADGNSSQGDVRSALRRAALAEMLDDESIEIKVMEVFVELEDRAQAAGRKYPFRIDNRGVVEVKTQRWQNFPAYVFCLCLSYFPLKETRVGPSLFEKVSCLAAKRYLHGKAVRFGAPREELPSAFPGAITEMCRRIGEGVCYRAQPSLNRQDDTVDVVAWRDFADERRSKIVMFGQCGAGRDWDGKLGELNPKAFWDQWVQESLVSPVPVKSFFTPYRIEVEKWDMCGRKGGILFDRCRIAYWADGQGSDYEPVIDWVNEFFEEHA